MLVVQAKSVMQEAKKDMHVGEDSGECVVRLMMQFQRTRQVLLSQRYSKRTWYVPIHPIAARLLNSC